MGIKQEALAQPIIIKRKRIVKADGHHGGAWKVAYADFVTAMMAFFLLMWLLNATTEEQRKGIADYFNPTIPISRISGGGSDGLNGSSIFTEETFAKMGTGASRSQSVDSHPSKDAKKDSEEEKAIAARLEDLKKGLTEDGHQISEHMLIKMSPEGIVVEVTDSDQTPLFPVGSSNPSDLLSDLMDQVAGSFGSFENKIKIVGHTDSRTYRNAAVYDNWNLSADRANTARRLLVRSGLPADRIEEVSGKADSEPLVPDDPSAAQNRRISITILTR
ncbi:MAG TPA: flagellar motor protein MotB [Hyphomonas sp.]|nr:flagellar motor protein MotB [Hyphomonas sp.]